MSTLYELLGALPHDDAEELRTAFRRAVKGVHPDLSPDDPDAALKFREIVRANEILCDPEQRKAYDHLLGLAHLEGEAASKQAPAEKIRKFASAVMAFTAASIMIIGGYLLFMYVSSSGSVASANNTESEIAGPSIATVSLPRSLNATEKLEGRSELKKTRVAPEALTSSAPTIPTTQRGPSLDLIANEEAEFKQAPQFDRDGDFTIAGADPSLQPAVIFYRLEKINAAFPILPAKPIQISKSFRPVPKITGGPRLDQAVRTPLRFAIFQTRRTAQNIAREKRVAQIR
jgi:curved DNA-binding protein CbpA